jgi:hypothetical protein
MAQGQPQDQAGLFYCPDTVPWCFLVFAIYYLHDVFKQAADIRHS